MKLFITVCDKNLKSINIEWNKKKVFVLFFVQKDILINLQII